MLRFARSDTKKCDAWSTISAATPTPQRDGCNSPAATPSTILVRAHTADDASSSIRIPWRIALLHLFHLDCPHLDGAMAPAPRHDFFFPAHWASAAK
jgi:hypothetical protein